MNIVKQILIFLVKVIIFITMVALVATSSLALGYVYVRSTASEPIDITDLTNPDKNTKIKDKVNILVMGRNAHLTDFIMLVGYDPATRKVSMLSIPRDTKYDGLNGHNYATSKINAVYQGKYPEKVVEKVEKMTGLEIKYYVVFDNKILWNVVDGIGGVTVDVGKKALIYSDPEQNLYINLKPGVQLLNGKKAEQFVRYRKGYANGDLGRIEAQQRFVKAFIIECLKPSKMVKLPGVVTTALKGVDTNITADVALEYLEDVAIFDMNNVRIEMLPGYPQTLGGVSFYVPKAKEVKTLVDEMYNNILPSESSETEEQEETTTSSKPKTSTTSSSSSSTSGKTTNSSSSASSKTSASSNSSASSKVTSSASEKIESSSSKTVEKEQDTNDLETESSIIVN